MTSTNLTETSTNLLATSSAILIEAIPEELRNNPFTDWFTTTRFLGIPLLNLSMFAVFLVAGLFLGWLIRIPVERWLKKSTAESDAETGKRVGRSIQRAVFLLIFCLVLKSGAIDILHLPGWAWEKSQNAISVLMAVACTILFLQIVEIALVGLRLRWQDGKSQVDASLIQFLRRGIRLAIILVAILVTADNIGFKVTGAIAGLGIGGAAIALGAQGLIANLLGTIEVVADKLYRVGDRIQFEQFDGFVTDLGLRSTRIRALSGEEILVPNRKMAEVQIRNYSRKGLVRTVLKVGITYSSTHDQVLQSMQIFHEIFKARQEIGNYQIYLKSLGDYSLDLEVVLWARYTTSGEYNSLVGLLYLEIKRRFDELHIEFAFPTQTLYLAATKTK
jgi:small-conductance mechanosensitive channel